MLRCFRYEEIDSTQNKAAALLEEGQVPPFSVVAESMTAARGRMARSWVFEKGRSIGLSLVLDLPSTALSGLSLIAGLSIIKYLDDRRLQLKWPNDVMLGMHKVGGVLVESRSHGQRSTIIVGVGLNCFDLNMSAFKGLGYAVDPEALAAQVAQVLGELSHKSFEDFRVSYEERLWMKAQAVTMTIDGRQESVRLVGVDAQGRLMTESSGHLSLHTSGEIRHE